MKKIDLAGAISILANIGVIAGIVFLGIELNQNNRLLEVEARADRAEIRRGSITRLMFSPELSEAFVKARAGGQLSDLELHYLVLQNDATLMDWQQVYREVQVGVLEDSIIPVETWRRVFRAQPNLSQRWTEVGREYEPAFVEFMRETIVQDE